MKLPIILKIKDFKVLFMDGNEIPNDTKLFMIIIDS